MQLVTVVDDLQNERDATLVALITNNDAGLAQVQAKTNSDLGPVRTEIQRIVNGGYPATIAGDAGAVNNDLSPENIGKQLHSCSTPRPGPVTWWPRTTGPSSATSSPCRPRSRWVSPTSR